MALPYNSNYDIKNAQIVALGGTVSNFDSEYEQNLKILELLQQGGGGGGGAAIDDNNVSTRTTYSSNKITQLLADAGFDTEIVETLPETGDIHTIYFKASADPQTQNTYDEFMYISGAWEQVGSTAIDLSDYAKTTDLSIYAKISDVDASLADYAKTTDLNDYAKTNDLSIYAKISDVNSSLADYVKTTDLNDYAKTNDLSIYAKISDVNSSLALKQDTLTAGTNITIQNNVISAAGGSENYIISDADASAGTYSNDISSFYHKAISEGNIPYVQIEIIDTYTINNTDHDVSSYYLPSSSRIFENYVELWLMYTENGATWENRHYVIDNTTISRDISTGVFG